MVGVVGAVQSDEGIKADRSGERIESALRNKNIEYYLVKDIERETTVKLRAVATDRNRVMARIDFESDFALSDAAAEELINRAISVLQNCDGLILSDYKKGVLSDNAVTSALISAARARKIPIVVDPKGSNWTRYNNATLLTPNVSELCVGARLDSDADLPTMTAEARNLIGALNLRAIALTRSAQGITLVEAGGSQPIEFPATTSNALDVTGAGDTVVATLASLLIAGKDLVTAVKLANIAAGIVVSSTPLSRTVTPGEIVSRMCG